MLTEAVIQTSNPTSLKLDDVDPDEILVLKSISNLSSVKVTQFMGDFAREGSYYQGRRGERRNPVFTLKLNPNYTEDIEVSDIRELLYRMFMEPGRNSDAVQVLLKDDRRPDRYFIGYTETIDTDAFAKEQTCTVSLLTTDAYLRSAELSTRTLEQGWFTLPIKYEGSADIGLTLTTRILNDTTRLTIQSFVTELPNVFFRLNGTFNKGDVITLSSVKGERLIQHLPGGNPEQAVDILDALTPESVWPTLNPDVPNIFSCYGLTPADGKAVITSYSYRAAWWGI